MSVFVIQKVMAYYRHYKNNRPLPEPKIETEEDRKVRERQERVAKYVTFNDNGCFRVDPRYYTEGDEFRELVRAEIESMILEEKKDKGESND